MRSTLILLLIIITVTLHAQSPRISNSHIVIEKATVSRVSPGMVKSNDEARGTSIYQIDIRLKSGNASSLKIESLFVNQQLLSVELIKGTERSATGPFAKGDKLLVLARSELSAGTPSASLQKVIASKKNVAAWLVYMIGTKQCLVPVQHFESSHNEKQNQ